MQKTIRFCLILFISFVSYFLNLSFADSADMQEYACCGGGTDANGMLWVLSGKYKCKYYDKKCAYVSEHTECKFFPEINTSSMVLLGGEISYKGLRKWPGAMDEYKRLIKISRIKYVNKDNKIYVTRELLTKDD